jgi:hypothetical protein
MVVRCYHDRREVHDAHRDHASDRRAALLAARPPPIQLRPDPAAVREGAMGS